MLKNLLTLCVCLSLSAKCIAYCDYWNDNYVFSVEYLYGKIQDGKKLIPLVVESPVVPDGSPVLGIPGSEVVLGDKKIESKWRSGARFTFGFGCYEYCGTDIEFSYFFLGKSNTTHSVSSSGSLTSSFFAVPYFNTVTGLESSLPIAVPGSFQGTAKVKVSNQIQGAEMNGVAHATFFEGGLDIFGGVRYVNFTERLRFTTNSPFIDTSLNNVYNTKDKFSVSSEFYGVQIGGNYFHNCGPWFINLKGQVAIGVMAQSSSIRGALMLNDFTNNTTVQEFKGGFFALPSNIGRHRRTRFSVVPEVNVNIGYEITESLSVQAGYNFLYLTNVLRAGEQINRNLNPTQSVLYQFSPTQVLVGSSRPSGSLHDSNMWVHGGTIKLEVIF